MATAGTGGFGSPENLYPIAILIDELKNDDAALRLNAMKKIDTIAIALGPERTRSELIPFLAESVDDDDEIILALAEKLGQFVHLVGGPQFSYVLLVPLEALIAVEETSVRDKAVQSIQKLVREMPQEHIITYLWPVLQRCAFRDWYTSRCSACGLIARMYSRLGFRPAGVTSSVVAALEAKSAGTSETSDEEFASMPVFKEDMVLLYQRLSGDETPMVRRACSSVMPDVGTAIAEGTLTTPDAFDNLSSVTPHGTMSDAKMIEDTGTVVKSGSADGYNVDTGDVTAGAVPPPVPSPIYISAATQEHGARATQALLPILQTFARDDQDSVRLLAVDNCVALARLVNGTPQTVADGSDSAVVRLSRFADLRGQVLATFNMLAGDRSWRVRWSVANRLGEVSDAAGPAITADHVLPVFERLMVDAEAEVRTAAAYRVSDIGRLASRDRIIAAILPCVDKLSEDTSEHVRAALASVILGIAPVLGEEATISMLLPIFLRLLRDSSAQVRLNIISKLEAVNAVIGLKMLSQSLLPAIGELSSDKQWRVRLAIIDFMPLLARQLGVEFFDVELTNLCIKWLTDSVFAIRDAAATNLRKLAEVFGSEWAHTVLIPRVVALKGEGSYQCRMTSLNAAVTLGEAVDIHTLQGELLAFIVGFAQDRVPNIRFNVAKALERLALKIEPMARAGSVRPALMLLASDAEDDVKFFATRALAKL